MELANQQMQRVEALYEKGSTTSHELQLAKHQVNLARLRLLETEASKSSLNSSGIFRPVSFATLSLATLLQAAISQTA